MSELTSVFLDIQTKNVKKLEKQLEIAREALDAVALPPYKDSDLKSLLETLQVIAQVAIAKMDAVR